VPRWVIAGCVLVFLAVLLRVYDWIIDDRQIMRGNVEFSIVGRYLLRVCGVQ
jgi:hypothetical protein